MTNLDVMVALGLVAWFVAPPAPAAAHHVGRFGGWRSHAIVRWRGYGLSGWSRSPRFFRRPWRGGYYYPNAGAWYFYPYTADYPNAGVSYSYAYTAYYPQEQAVDVNAVTIRMHVPGNARVWFEGGATSQSGENRTFVSPSLVPGREYVYHIRVQWDENDKAVEHHREVTVHAGDQINLTIDK
jgi:uncharacterized protein (TIGR03000 family)